MKNPLQIIHIGDREVELLYTISLYKILQDRKQSVVIEKGATWSDVTTALLKMIYAAYINAIQVRQLDDANYKPEALAVMDFFVWSEECPKEFAEQIKICYYFITGHELDEVLDDQKKKDQQEVVETATETTPARMSFLQRIGAKFKTSSSESVERAKERATE